MSDHVGDDPTPHAGSGAPRRSATQLASDPAFTGTYVQSLIVSGTGIDRTGATDSTAAIQAILDAADAATQGTTYGGAEVVFPEGIFLSGPLTIGSRCTVRGRGLKTILRLKPNATGAAQLNLKRNTDERVTIRDIALDGNKANQTNPVGGIQFINTGPDAGSYTAIANLSIINAGDPCHYFENVWIVKTKGDGFNVVGRGGDRLINVNLNACDGRGFYLQSADNVVTNCSTGSSGLEGFLLAGANTKLTGCDAFYAGQIATANGDGFSIQANRLQISNCLAQNNWRHGFYLGPFGECNLTGISADSNALNMQFGGSTQGHGIVLDGCGDCSIDGIFYARTTEQGYPAQQFYGVYFVNNPTNNTVRAGGGGNTSRLWNDAFNNVFISRVQIEFGLSATGTSTPGILSVYSGTRSSTDPAYCVFGNRIRFGYNGAGSAIIDGNGSDRSIVFAGTTNYGTFSTSGLTIPSGKAVNLPPTATSSLPSASTAGAGAITYDSSRHKLVASDGSSWNSSGDPGFPTTWVGPPPSGAQIWPVASEARYVRVLGSGTISKVGMEVVTSSGNISVAVYRRSGNGKTATVGALVASSGAVACPAAGYAEVPLGSSVDVYEGDYLALSCDNTTASFTGFSGNANAFAAPWSYSGGTQHPLPSGTPTVTASRSRMPALVGAP